MKKLIKFVTDKYYLLGSMTFSIVALLTLAMEGGTFHFWMLTFAAAVLSGLHDIINKN